MGYGPAGSFSLHVWHSQHTVSIILITYMEQVADAVNAVIIFLSSCDLL